MKASPVKFIGRTFKHADMVINLLGRRRGRRHRCFRPAIPNLCMFRRLVREIKEDREGLDPFTRRNEMPEALKNLNTSTNDDDIADLRAREDIVYNSGWTQRRWVAQENALNSNIKFLRGSCLVDQQSDHLLPLCQVFGLLPSPTTINPARLRQALVTADMWRNLQQTMRRPTLLRLLYVFAALTQCTNSPAKLYNLLGMNDNTQGINATYRMSSASVSRDLPWKIVRHTKSLDIFGLVTKALLPAK